METSTWSWPLSRRQAVGPSAMPWGRVGALSRRNVRFRMMVSLGKPSLEGHALAARTRFCEDESLFVLQFICQTKREENSVATSGILVNHHSCVSPVLICERLAIFHFVLSRAPCWSGVSLDRLGQSAVTSPAIAAAPQRPRKRHELGGAARQVHVCALPAPRGREEETGGRVEQGLRPGPNGRRQQWKVRRGETPVSC
jgi:hypothetical protein